jgi:hypothetical protein
VKTINHEGHEGAATKEERMRDLKNKRNFSRLLQNQFFLHVKGFVCFVVKLLLFVVSGGVQGERFIAKCKLGRTRGGGGQCKMKNTKRKMERPRGGTVPCHKLQEK